MKTENLLLIAGGSALAYYIWKKSKEQKEQKKAAAASVLDDGDYVDEATSGGTVGVTESAISLLPAPEPETKSDIIAAAISTSPTTPVTSARSRVSTGSTIQATPIVTKSAIELVPAARMPGSTFVGTPAVQPPTEDLYDTFSVSKGQISSRLPTAKQIVGIKGG